MAEIQQQLFEEGRQKISVTVAKKVPIPGIDYSSVNAAATIEVAVTDLSEAELRQAYRSLYNLVEGEVDERINQSQKEARAQNQGGQPVP